jgi:hypothetical protein
MDEEIVLNLQECPPKYDSMQIDELIDLLTKLQKKTSPKRKSKVKNQKGSGENFEKQKEQLILKINTTKNESEKAKLIELLNQLSKEKYNTILEQENASQLKFLRDLQQAINKKINSIPQSPERSDLFEKSNQLSRDISNYLKLLEQQRKTTSSFDKNFIQNQIDLIMIKYKHGYRIANYLNSDINYVMNFLTAPNLSPVEEKIREQMLSPISVKSESLKSKSIKTDFIKSPSPSKSIKTDFIKSPTKKFIPTSPLRKEIKNFEDEDLEDIISMYSQED